jgi:hypothetical protein
MWFKIQRKATMSSHVIHLSVQAPLDALPNPDDFDIRNVSDPAVKATFRQTRHDPKYVEALESHLVGRTAEVVKQLRVQASDAKNSSRRFAIPTMISALCRHSGFSKTPPSGYHAVELDIFHD